MSEAPTREEQTEFSIRAFRGVEVGLGQADPTAAISAKLEAKHPGHLVLVQAGKFLHGFDRTAYALNVLKQYKMKLVGTAEEPRLRVGFPVGNFKRRLWSMVADFGIPYVVALGTQAEGHTVYVSEQPAGNVSVLDSVSDRVVHEVITDSGSMNPAVTTGRKACSHTGPCLAIQEQHDERKANFVLCTNGSCHLVGP